MAKKERIILPHGVGTKLAKVFGCTPAMVSNALNGNRESELARKIRHVAVTQYGGQVVTVGTS